jgi:hypothetical protein
MINSATLAPMYATVKRLRERGLRKVPEGIQSDPGTTGDLRLAKAKNGTVPELRVLGGDGMRPESLLPILYEAALVTMLNELMLFRGVERGADGAEYVQEWSAMILNGGVNG